MVGLNIYVANIDILINIFSHLNYTILLILLIFLLNL